MAAIEGSQVRTANKLDSIEFLKNLIERTDIEYVTNENGTSLTGKTENEHVLFFKKPLIFPAFQRPFSLEQYIREVENQQTNALLFLAQASGNVALALCKEEEIVKHKVIRKYTQRKKQGKSQIKHLKTKGKSRLGSRIRLQQTKQLIEETHDKLREWNAPKEASHLLVSCDIRLWSVFHEPQFNPSFDKNDSRIKKIPLDLDEPNFKVLRYVLNYAYKSYIETKF